TTHDALPTDSRIDRSTPGRGRADGALTRRTPGATAAAASPSVLGTGHRPVPATETADHVRDALRRAEAVLAHSADLVILFREDGTIDWVSGSVRMLLGVDPEDVIGQSGFDLIHPDDLPRVLADFWTIPNLGDSVRTEFRIHDADGSVRWMEEVATNLLDEPSIGAVVGNLRDITARKEGEQSAARLLAVLEASHDAIFSVDPDGTVTSWNGGAVALFGYSPDQIVGRPVRTLLSNDDPAQLHALDERVRRGERVTVDIAMRTSEGRWLQAELSIAPLHDAAGDYTGTSSIARDMTERIELQQRIEDDRRRLAEAQATAGLGSFEFDLDTGRGYRSEELCRILGTPERIFDNLTLDATHPEDRVSVREFLAMDHEEDDECVHRIVRPDGEVRWVTTRRTPAGHDLPGSRVFVGTMMDITERHETERELVHQAMHDPLTGLLNRGAIMELLQERLDGSRTVPSTVAVAFFDLDQFKRINDSLGHSTGDRILREVGLRLTSHMRDGDLVGRFGGDEFLLVRPGARNLDDARALAADAEAALRAPVKIAGRTFELTASIGVTLSDRSDSAESLLRDADAAMYQAKADGRAHSAVFDAVSRGRAHRRVTLQTALAQALSNSELHLVYQPIIELADDSVAGFEALLRWNHPALGPVGPDEFIPLAEATGLIVPIGDWVIEESVRQLAEWRRLPSVRDDLWVAVNLSTSQLGRAGLADHVATTLRDAALPAELLHLEVTESLLMDRVEHAMATLAELRRMGARVSIDDFGTGYSSLSYLNRLSIDTLKVDRSFIQDLGTAGHDPSIVRAITALAASLGLTVVAEGIESPEQVPIVAELGCDFGQGYVWSRPIAPSEALEWMLRRDDGPL
ncbi:MAG: sensor domain-containing protein, partial [Microthrixaceae bacterium]